MPITDFMTPQWVKDRYLVGIDLTDDNGNDYPDVHYEFAIDTAIAMYEAKYDVTLRRTRTHITRESHDSNWWDADTWYLTLSEHRPLRDILKFEIKFGGFPASEIPLSWARVVSRPAGQIQIVPGPEGFKSPYIVGGSPLLGFAGLNGRGYVPEWIKIQYTTGFEYDLSGTLDGTAGAKQVTFTPASADELDVQALRDLRVGSYLYLRSVDQVVQVADIIDDTTVAFREELFDNWVAQSAVVLDYDPALLDIIGLTASLPILDTAGDLIIGAGISNQSISIDGLSQSIGTTSGVENSGYGARATQYRKRIEELDHAIRRRYRRVNMAIV